MNENMVDACELSKVTSLEDFEAMWSLIEETGDCSDRFVKKEDLKSAVICTESQNQKLVEYLLVKDHKSGKVVGVVSTFYLFSTWEGLFIFIDEFLLYHSTIVERDAIDRPGNIELLLLKKIIQEALEKDCNRTQFYLNKEEITSIERHKSLGGIPLYDWLTVRLPNKALIELAEQPNTFKGQYTIRVATVEDVPSILYLIQCLADYEKEPNAVKVGEKVLLETGFGKQCYYQCLLAESDTVDKETADEDSHLLSSSMAHNPRVIGMALFHDIYCKRRGKVLHLEDLFVKEEHRKRGLGTGLMRECAKIGVSSGCNEMDWQVLDWNTNAINFYEKLGGVILKDLVFIRYTKEAMKKLVERL